MGYAKWCCRDAGFKRVEASVAGHTGAICNLCPIPERVLKCAIKRQTVHEGRKLPRRLIGEKCTAVVEIAGTECNCLLDTGSQVTTVAQSFYSRCLSDQPVQPTDQLLTVQGANGQSVPYLGYIEICIKFPKDFLQSQPAIPTLVLVAPYINSSGEVPLIIGTNTLDAVYEQCSDESPTLGSFPHCGYIQVWRTLSKRQKQATSGRLSFVKFRRQTEEVLPAGQKTLLEG